MKSNTQIVSVEFSAQIESTYAKSNADKTIDARLVHQELHIKRKYSNWILDLMNENGIGIKPAIIRIGTDSNRKVGRPIETSHLLSQRDVKEVLMCSKTPRGKAVRKWYLDMEEAFVAQTQSRGNLEGFDSAELETLRTLARHVIGKTNVKLIELDARLERIERRSNSMIGILSRMLDFAEGVGPRKRPIALVPRSQTKIPFDD